MHIPENYLSPSTCGVTAVAMVPVWANAVRKVKRDIPKEKMPLLGIGAAFSFIGMMFNVPMPGGTTGHAVGGTLIAMMLGPDAACISVSIALLLQALLFGDGGILAFGANCFNMAFVLPYLGYAIYRLCKKRISGAKGGFIGAALGSYVGINAAALCAAIEFGIQPYLFKGASGQALYCPYDLSVSIPAMMIGHLTIFGLAEVLFTLLIYGFVRKVSPSLFAEKEEKVPYNKKGEIFIGILLAVLMLLVPLGLLAEGTAWGEWGAEEIAEVVSDGNALGYTPDGMQNGFEWTALIPDYSIESMNDVVGYYISAVLGIAILVLIFRLIAGMMKNKVDFTKKAEDK